MENHPAGDFLVGRYRRIIILKEIPTCWKNILPVLLPFVALQSIPFTRLRLAARWIASLWRIVHFPEQNYMIWILFWQNTIIRKRKSKRSGLRLVHNQSYSTYESSRSLTLWPRLECWGSNLTMQKPRPGRQKRVSLVKHRRLKLHKESITLTIFLIPALSRPIYQNYQDEMLVVAYWFQ
jgi:hypothetical protein